MLAPSGDDPLGRTLLRGLKDMVGEREAHVLETVAHRTGEQQLLMSVWLSIRTLCFLPRKEAPEDVTLLFAFDVQRDRPGTRGKLVGFLGMCRTVGEAKTEAYRALTMGKIKQALAGTAEGLQSRMLIDVVIARLPGVGEALVTSALGAVMRMRKPTHGVYSVAVSEAGGKLFRRLGFEQLESPGFVGQRGVYYVAKQRIDITRFAADRVPSHMTGAVCTRRAVRDPQQVIARC